MSNQVDPFMPYKPSSSSAPVSLGLRRYTQSQNISTNTELTFSQVARFLLLHVPLMLIFRSIPILASIYSLLILLVGLRYLVRDQTPTRVIWVIAYIAGAEILWRGAEAAILWEYGKYATLFLCILTILKYRLAINLWSLLFIALLVPGIFVVPNFDRSAISYQLAGPVTLAFVSMTCCAVELKKSDIKRLFIAIVAPTVAMGFFVFIMLLTQNITFYGSGENEAITGGIGSNQVASALSLGAMAAFLYGFLPGEIRKIRYLMILVGLILLGLSVLTFSRSGLWNTAGALTVGIFYITRGRQQTFRIMAILLVVAALVYFVGFPILNNLTGGAVVERFSDFDSTGRDILFQIDYKLFLENPIWGVGVGQSPHYHIPYFGYPKPPHTEYSRLLAEHGILGVVAIVLLAGVTLFRLISNRPPISKGISTAFTSWSLLYMVHSATRMVAPSLAFGIAAARFALEEEVDA